MCSVYYPVDHGTHKCVELIIKADREKDKLGNVMRTIIDHLNKSRELSESITRHSTKLLKASDDVKCQVRESSDEIIREVKYREEAIIQDVEENNKQAGKILKGEEDKNKLTQDILQHLQYSSSQLFLYGSQYELVTKDKSIEQTFQDNNPDDVELNLPELEMLSDASLAPVRIYNDLVRRVL